MNGNSWMLRVWQFYDRDWRFPESHTTAAGNHLIQSESDFEMGGWSTRDDPRVAKVQRLWMVMDLGVPEIMAQSKY